MSSQSLVGELSPPGGLSGAKSKWGETVELVGIRDTRSTTVTGVEMFQKTLDEGMAGDNVGVSPPGCSEG